MRPRVVLSPALLALVGIVLASAARAQEFVPAVVFDMGGKFDKSFNEGAYTGAERSRRKRASSTATSR